MTQPGAILYVGKKTYGYTDFASAGPPIPAGSSVIYIGDKPSWSALGKTDFRKVLTGSGPLYMSMDDLIQVVEGPYR